MRREGDGVWTCVQERLPTTAVSVHLGGSQRLKPSHGGEGQSQTLGLGDLG